MGREPLHQGRELLQLGLLQPQGRLPLLLFVLWVQQGLLQPLVLLLVLLGMVLGRLVRLPVMRRMPISVRAYWLQLFHLLVLLVLVLLFVLWVHRGLMQPLGLLLLLLRGLMQPGVEAVA